MEGNEIKEENIKIWLRTTGIEDKARIQKTYTEMSVDDKDSFCYCIIFQRSFIHSWECLRLINSRLIDPGITKAYDIVEDIIGFICGFIPVMGCGTGIGLASKWIIELFKNRANKKYLKRTDRLLVYLDMQVGFLTDLPTLAAQLAYTMLSAKKAWKSTPRDSISSRILRKYRQMIKGQMDLFLKARDLEDNSSAQEGYVDSVLLFIYLQKNIESLRQKLNQTLLTTASKFILLNGHVKIAEDFVQSGELSSFLDYPEEATDVLYKEEKWP